MSEGAVAGKVTYGSGGDYDNLDALVYDAVMMLDPGSARARTCASSSAATCCTTSTSRC
jgi:hypothetical protein